MFCWQTIFVAADSCMPSLYMLRSSDPTCAFLAIDIFVQLRASFNLDGCDSASLLHTSPLLSIERFVFFYCNFV